MQWLCQYSQETMFTFGWRVFLLHIIFFHGIFVFLLLFVSLMLLLLLLKHLNSNMCCVCFFLSEGQSPWAWAYVVRMEEWESILYIQRVVFRTFVDTEWGMIWVLSYFVFFFCLFVSPLFERRSPKRGNRLVIWKFRHRATLLYSTLSHKNVSLFAVPKVDGWFFFLLAYEKGII